MDFGFLFSQPPRYDGEPTRWGQHEGYSSSAAYSRSGNSQEAGTGAVSSSLLASVSSSEADLSKSESSESAINTINQEIHSPWKGMRWPPVPRGVFMVDVLLPDKLASEVNAPTKVLIISSVVKRRLHNNTWSDIVERSDLCHVRDIVC